MYQLQFRYGGSFHIMLNSIYQYCSTYVNFFNIDILINSCWADSQLIRLSPEPDETGTCIEVMDHFTNIGPITDMIVVDLEKQGQVGRILNIKFHTISLIRTHYDF